MRDISEDSFLDLQFSRLMDGVQHAAYAAAPLLQCSLGDPSRSCESWTQQLMDEDQTPVYLLS